MAEGVGFEPTKVSLAGFQDRCTRPLCEPSVVKLTGGVQGRKIARNESGYSGRVRSSSITIATPSK